MEKLLESFKTLLHLSNLIQLLMEGHETLMENAEQLENIKLKGHYSNVPFHLSVSGSLQIHTLIVSCSFLDEYNEKFSAKENPKFFYKIEKLKKITKPLMKRIGKWQDLKKYRNNILAHNWRVKGKSFFSSDHKTRHYNVPGTNDEYTLLSKLISMIAYCISLEFPELVKQIDLKENLKSKIKFNYPIINIDKELEVIGQEVNLIRSTLFEIEQIKKTI